MEKNISQLIIEDYIKIDKNLDKEINLNLQEIYSPEKWVNINIEKLECDFNTDFDIFMKQNFSKYEFPILLNYFTKIKYKENDNNLYDLFFILKFIDSFAIVENKLSNYYLSHIREFNFNLRKDIINLISKDNIISNQYDEFLRKYSFWFCNQEIIYLFIFIFEKYFDINFFYNKNSFDIQNKYKVSISTFIKKSSSYLIGKCLSDSNTVIKIFGLMSYSSFMVNIFSELKNKIKIPSFLISAKTLNYNFLTGNTAFNILIYNICDYFSTYSNNICFSELEILINEINNKFDEIKSLCIKLFKVLTLKKLLVNENQVYKLYIEKIIDKISLTLNHLLSIYDDINLEDEKKIEINSMKWIENNINNDDKKNSNWVLIDIIK